MSFSRSAALCLGLSCLASAQDAPGLAVQVHLLTPLQNLRDANGGKVGGGFSLAMIIPLEDGWSWRVDLGHDRFPRGAKAGAPDVTSEVDVSHLAVEGIYQLRDTPGPYVFAGLGGYSWYVKESDAVLGTSASRRVAHVGGSMGFGYRITANLDVEIRGMGGKVDPTFTAGWVGVAAAWRF